MTDSEAALNARIAKFKRRAKNVRSQAHLDKIMQSFPVDQHEKIASIIAPVLLPTLEARSVQPVDIRPVDPDKPILQEETARRLNMQREQIAALQETNRVLEAQVKSLREQLKNKPEGVKSI